MIKLIVSDIDGTLLPYGQTELSPELFNLIGRLWEKGVLFCPASGRQFHSLRALFTPIADKIDYMCENGAVLFGAGTEEGCPLLGKTVMPRADAEQLACEVLALDGCEVLISGERTSYISARNPDFIDQMLHFTGNIVQVVEGPAAVPEDILKVSVFCPAGPEIPKAVLGPRWDGRFNMAVAGPDWVDFTLADKGTGLRCLCEALGIGLDEVIAFGDNFNDLPMLRIAGTAYLMENAVPELKQGFPRLCKTVEVVLADLLDTL